MPISIEAPAYPSHEGGVKFSAQVTNDCVSQAKEEFVAAHAKQYSQVYLPDSFDLVHGGSVLADDYCDMQFLDPPFVRIKRPRGLRHATSVTIPESRDNISSVNDLDALEGPSDSSDTWLCCTNISLTVILVALVLVWWLWPRRSRTKPSARKEKATTRRKSSPRRRSNRRTSITVSGIPKTKKLNLNGTYVSVGEGYDTRDERYVGASWINIEHENIVISVVDKIWQFSNLRSDSTQVLAQSSGPAPDVESVASWDWIDFSKRDSSKRRRKRSFSAKVRHLQGT